MNSRHRSSQNSPRSVITAMTFVIFSGLSMPCVAQDAPPIVQMTEAFTNAMLAPLLGRRELGVLVAERGIDARDVNLCARQLIEQDPRMKKLLPLDLPRLLALPEPQKVQAYVFGRVHQSVMTCLSRELDQTLQASSILR